MYNNVVVYDVMYTSAHLLMGPREERAVDHVFKDQLNVGGRREDAHEEQDVRMGQGPQHLFTTINVRKQIVVLWAQNIITYITNMKNILNFSACKLCALKTLKQRVLQDSVLF